MRVLFGSRTRTRVRMAMPKTLRWMIVLLTLYFSLQNDSYRHSLSVYFEELLGAELPRSHSREKRQALEDISDYLVDVQLSVLDFEAFRRALDRIPLPAKLSGTDVVNITRTTVCSPIGAGVECKCEDGFAWPESTCLQFGVCDAIVDGTCGCIDKIPPSGPFCQPELIAFEIDIELQFPSVNGVPSNILSVVRERVRNLPLPIVVSVSNSLTLQNATLTSTCVPTPTGGQQCQCEDNFAWPCNECDVFNVCNNSSTLVCSCINGLPTDGQFCEPITNRSPCTTTIPPTTTTVQSTTLAKTTTMTVPTNTTTQAETTTTTEPTATTTQAKTTTTTKPTATTTQAKTTTTTEPTATTIQAKTTTTTEPTATTTQAKTTTKAAVVTTTTTKPTTTTIPTTALTTTTTTPIAQAPEVRTLTLTINLDFMDSYNDSNSEVYRNTQNAIREQCERRVVIQDCTSNIIEFRSGSTIAEYTISAPSISDNQITNFNAEVYKEMGKIFAMIFQSTSTFNIMPMSNFFGSSMNMTCGPPPSQLNLGVDVAAQWYVDGIPVIEDSDHRYSREGERATLTVSKLSSTDQGIYECRLMKNVRMEKGIIFRETSSRAFKLRKTPVIQVDPVQTTRMCDTEDPVKLSCSVQSPYQVRFAGIDEVTPSGKIEFDFEKQSCEMQEFTCEVVGETQFRRVIVLEFSTDEFECVNDEVFGDGFLDEVRAVPCEANEVGNKTARCQEGGLWGDRKDTCILQVVQELLEESEDLNANNLPVFLEALQVAVTEDFTQEVTSSPSNINGIVGILNNVADTSSNVTVSQTSMENILLTVGTLTIDAARGSWQTLNDDAVEDNSGSGSSNSSASSTLLASLETLTDNLVNQSFDIQTPFIILNKTTFINSFSGDFNDTVEIDIANPDGGNQTITVLNFASLNNVLPPRDEDNSSFNVINGRVVLVQSSGSIDNVSFTFEILNETLKNPQCVFWNFSLFEGLGGWDSEGCRPVLSTNESVSCECNHLTSFSILMSPFAPKLPVLDFITYIGVGISIASLVICLIIEAVIWRKIRRNTTSYLRHVSIVNIAVSLLIADIWFIIGAAVSDLEQENPPACTAATFFIHFFYLALFFWMLASALLLLYRTISVFDGGLSKRAMLAIGFCMGYGMPLLIAVITIAVTAPTDQYTSRSGVCWLSAKPSYSLLAFVIPALLIVLINFVILLVVLYKMLRRRVAGDAAQAGEKSALVVIARSLAVLTPFFGLTWGLGIGTLVNPKNNGIHIAFAFFNSLQGFFILVFGTLLDKKVRTEIANMSSSGGGTRTTSAGNSSSSGFLFFRNWRRGRDGYNVSSNTSDGAHHSYTNT